METLQLQSLISALPISTAFSDVIWLQGAFMVPDCIMPLFTTPLVTGDISWALTELEPADSPNRVIHSGLPPKAWALSFSQRMARA